MRSDDVAAIDDTQGRLFAELHGVFAVPSAGSLADVDEDLADGAVLDCVVSIRCPLERISVQWQPGLLSDR
jgi:hypothetical protein